MSNIEIPYDAWQAMIERAAQNNSEPVPWPGKTMAMVAPSHDYEEIDVTYAATYLGDSAWSFDMIVSGLPASPSTFTVWHGKSKRSKDWTEIRTPGYRRKQRSPARMSKEWRERRKAMEGH